MLLGVPGGIRTHGLSLRRRTLYPAELQRHIQLRVQENSQRKISGKDVDIFEMSKSIIIFFNNTVSFLKSQWFASDLHGISEKLINCIVFCGLNGCQMFYFRCNCDMITETGLVMSTCELKPVEKEVTI